ncbi:uncharacterized protein [Symphalangus syndactylus]|uniref:uncharacterized protein n=1 Tax=Symphalangus syndactylus TaxID=9590 RepID=UPI00300650AE
MPQQACPLHLENGGPVPQHEYPPLNVGGKSNANINLLSAHPCKQLHQQIRSGKTGCVHHSFACCAEEYTHDSGTLSVHGKCLLHPKAVYHKAVYTNLVSPGLLGSVSDAPLCACAGAVSALPPAPCACAGAGAVPLRGRNCVLLSTDPESIARAELSSPLHRLRRYSESGAVFSLAQTRGGRAGGTARAELCSAQHRPWGHREGRAAFSSAQTLGALPGFGTTRGRINGFSGFAHPAAPCQEEEETPRACDTMAHLAAGGWQQWRLQCTGAAWDRCFI